MKIIKLKGVHYLSYKGITLTMNKPYIEANDENINKLSEYIKLGFLEIKEHNDKEDVEDKYKSTNLSLQEKLLEDTTEPMNGNIIRFPSLEELEKMSKKELIELLDSFNIKYKPNMKKEELIRLVIA